MLGELGNFFLILAFGFTCVQMLASFWGVCKASFGVKAGIEDQSKKCHPELVSGSDDIFKKMLKRVHHDKGESGDKKESNSDEQNKWLILGRVAALTQGGFVACAFITLLIAFLVCDFSLLTVLLNDHTQLPWCYRLSAVWGSHEGSFLLFVLILSSVSVGFSLFLPRSLLQSRALIFQGLLTALFLAFLLVISNPFDALPFTPLEGQSLNPLLQDRGLMIHPPLLFLGYVGFSAPFTLALTALWGKENSKDWAVLTRPWALFAWVSLTAGVTLGSWWAYYELGWGGWWFWDPVENISLMPWLSGTALLHMLLRERFYGGALFLSLLTFGLSLLGTFLVRSGLLLSVHSFANDPQQGITLLIITGIIMGFAFFMWVWRAPSLKNTPVSLISQEGSLLLHFLLLSVGLATVVLGTLYPLWSDLMGWGKTSIGAPYFERTFIPLMIPFLLLIPLGSLLRDEKESLFALLITPLTATLGAGMLILYFLYPASLLALLGIGVGGWVASGTFVAFLKKRLSLGAFLAHLGVAISLLGVSVGGGFRKDESKILGLEESMKVGEIPLTFENIVQGKESTYLYERASFAYPGGVLNPEKRFFEPQRSLLSKTSISTNGLRDLYVILGPYQGNNRWLVRASSIPLAPWIWIGGAFMVLGAGISFLKRLQPMKPVLITSLWRRRSKPGKQLKSRVASSLTLLAMTWGGISFPYLLGAVRATAIQTQENIEKKAQALFQEVRCPVCLGQSLVDSEMKESEEIKDLILESLKKGESEDAIRQKLRSLHGNQILFRPPFDSSTLFLWLAPFGLFFIVLLGLFCFKKVSSPWHGEP